MSFEDQMGEHEEQWENDQRKAGTLSDGDYTAQITEMRIEHDETDDTYTVVTRLEDQSGGGSVRKWYNLDHEIGRSICAQDMKALGYQGKLSGLRAWIESEEPIGLVCEIRVKTKPGDDRDFTNVYINRVLGKKGLATAGATTGAVGDDDDIPF